MSTARKPAQRGQRLGTGAGIRRNEPPKRGAGPSRRWTIIGLAVAVLAAVVAGAIWQVVGGDDATEGRPQVVEARLARTTLDPVSQPTWTPNYDSLTAVNEALDLPGMSESVYHIHAHLTLYADGRQVVVPANIAYDPAGQQASPIHTHDERGVIHVEADDPDFRANLGQLFDVWGVAFTSERLGGYSDVQMWVNGEPYEGDPRAYELESHDAITVLAGAEPDGFEPRDSYKFQPGE